MAIPTRGNTWSTIQVTKIETRGNRLVYFDVSFEKFYGFAGHGHAVAAMFAVELAAAFRNLAGVQFGFAEAPGPVGNQGAMCGSSDGIFGHAFGGGEKSRDKIAVGSGGGHDGCEPVDGGELVHIRLKRTDFGFAVEDAEIIARAEDGPGLGAQGIDQGGI